MNTSYTKCWPDERAEITRETITRAEKVRLSGGRVKIAGGLMHRCCGISGPEAMVFIMAARPLYILSVLSIYNHMRYDSRAA